MTSSNTRRVRLTWAGRGLVFQGGRPDGPEAVIDGGSAEGPSPMEALLLSAASCMAVDVLHVLNKSRVTVETLAVDVEGERAETYPRRYLSLVMRFTVAGPGEEDVPKLERALALSRETYCSVLHTLRQDLDVRLEIRRVEGGAPDGEA